jgi:hypothetical protein
MPEKENTLYVEQKDQSAYAIYANEVKSPDLVHTYGNIDKKTHFL